MVCVGAGPLAVAAVTRVVLVAVPAVTIIHARVMPYVDVRTPLPSAPSPGLARLMLPTVPCVSQARMNTFELVSLFATSLIFFIGVFTNGAGTHVHRHCVALSM